MLPGGWDTLTSQSPHRQKTHLIFFFPIHGVSLVRPQTTDLISFFFSLKLLSRKILSDLELEFGRSRDDPLCSS
jgi:hypothetical protein